MTKSQALSQAKKWWGKTAFASKVKRNGMLEYRVGLDIVVLLPMRCVKGTGKTWQEAIDNVRPEERKKKF